MRITVFNQKGGTGKTTVAIHLARALGEGTKLIDLDPQGSATHLLGVDNPGRGLYQALKGEVSLESVLVNVEKWGVALAPATIDLAGFERERLSRQESRLSDLLEQSEGGHVVIDCPPGVGWLAQNALVASDLAVIVTEPSYPAMLGLREAIASVEAIRRRFNPRLRFGGVVLNRVLPTSESRYRLKEVAAALGGQRILCRIPQRAAVAEAAGELRPCEHPAITSGINELKERLLNG